MDALEGEKYIEDIAVFGSGLHVRVKNGDRPSASIRQRLEAAGVEVILLERIEASMEDVFVGLIEAEERKS
jgi:ABC-2 type transport system ATP-binding protein